MKLAIDAVAPATNVASCAELGTMERIAFDLLRLAGDAAIVYSTFSSTGSGLGLQVAAELVGRAHGIERAADRNSFAKATLRLRVSLSPSGNALIRTD